MASTTEQVKKLRDETGVSIMDCKKALDEAKGDLEKARKLLEARSKAVALKKQSREVGAGIVTSYIHSNDRVGVLLELHCETEFVARNDQFKALAYDIALHVAAMKPEYISHEDFPKEFIEERKKFFADEVAKEKKPKEVQQKIIDGKLDAFLKENSLLSQTFVKNSEQTVADVIADATATLGEKIVVGRFVRFEV